MTNYGITPTPKQWGWRDMMEYYTISNRDTNKPLGLGGPLDRDKALSIIRTRTKGDDGSKFAPSEWMVTGWIGAGDGEDEIEFQMSADEFSACNGDAP